MNPEYIFFYPLTSQDRAQFFTMKYTTRRYQAQCYRFFTSCTSVSNFLTCVQLISVYCTLQLCKTASRHFEASFELEELDAVNNLNE